MGRVDIIEKMMWNKVKCVNEIEVYIGDTKRRSRKRQNKEVIYFFIYYLTLLIYTILKYVIKNDK